MTVNLWTVCAYLQYSECRNFLLKFSCGVR